MVAQLRYDPFSPFRRQFTPHALYVRRTMLGDRTAARRTAERRQRNEVLLGQREDGSWNDSVALTIDRLYLLYLLGDEGTREAQRATGWLLERDTEPLRHTCRDGVVYDGLFLHIPERDKKDLRTRRGLVTCPGSAGFIKTGAALYFASLFNLHDDERAERAFAVLADIARRRGFVWGSLACSANILRAFVAHPRYGTAPVTRAWVEQLEALQTRNGGWNGTPFFYHVFHVVAHASGRSARRQVETACVRLHRAQNADGAWGRTHRDLLSVLVLDGLRRQGLLPPACTT